MKISIYPYNSDTNKYIELIKKSISSLGIELNSFDTVWNDKEFFKDTEYFIFNWYESLYTNSLIKQFYIFIKKYIKLLILKNQKKKIIWVLHNAIPHDSKHRIFSLILMKYLAKNSYNIIIHSNESKNVLADIVNYNIIKNKVTYIPHPNYIGVYEEVNIKRNLEKKLNLLFIGAIKPYKNVDLLIEVFNELKLNDMTLTLAGKIINEEYEDYINNLINNNSNIICDFRFIEDNEIQGLIQKSDILVLPYDITSSLNSGTIILAFSNKRTVLSPNIGTLKDFKQNDMFFSYEYQNIDSHKAILKSNIKKVYEIYMKDKNKIKSMGEKCYETVKTNNSTEKISLIFKDMLIND